MFYDDDDDARAWVLITRMPAPAVVRLVWF
jgi:hypothetical protein